MFVLCFVVLKYLLFSGLLFTENITHVKYNNSVKLYTNGELKLSKEQFESILPGLIDSNIKSKSYFYIANIYFKMGDYLQSIDYYKNALRQNPNLDEAKYNLILARKLLVHQNKKNTSKEENKLEENISDKTDETLIKDFFIKVEELENNSRNKYNQEAKSGKNIYKKNW